MPDFTLKHGANCAINEPRPEGAGNTDEPLDITPDVGGQVMPVSGFISPVGDSTRLQEYRQFIASKAATVRKDGMQPKPINDMAKEHQRAALSYALEIGKSAAFLDTGLGKSFIELEWARQVSEETGKPVLILTPLAVAGQMIREGVKFGIEARQIREQSEVGAGVMVANYERLPKLDPASFGGVVLDESSILKSFGGKTVTLLCEMFRNTPYKLAATATPAPNDHMEIGQHSDFLDVMPGPEMLSRWFIADQKKMGAYRLKGHATDNFWSWVASWSRCATLPSDLGGDDAGYVLPKIKRQVHTITADRMVNVEDGMLFRIPEMSATSFHKEKRLTMQERCERAAELANHDKPVTVWCETNEESALLTSLIDGAVEVRGDQKPEEKEARLLGFADGQYRAIVTKPKLAGFGVNWQHCAHAVFASISFSYEQHYQAVRRSHRFGQTEQVRNDIVIADTEAQVWEIVQRKSQDHDTMKSAMAKAMKAAQTNSSLRVEYGDRQKLVFPQWLISQEA